MKLLKIFFIVLLAISTNLFAADESGNSDDNHAIIAGGIAAGATAVGAGALAATGSAAAITSTIAAVGLGSMAVGIGVVAAAPALVGGGVYVAYKWFSTKVSTDPSAEQSRDASR